MLDGEPPGLRGEFDFDDEELRDENVKLLKLPFDVVLLRFASEVFFSIWGFSTACSLGFLRCRKLDTRDMSLGLSD